MFRRLTIVVAAAVGLTLAAAVPAQSAPRHPAVYTVTVQWDAVRGVPKTGTDWWESGTKLGFVRGDCSGAMCIHVHDWSTQPYCNIASVGCAGMPGPVIDVRVGQCDIWLNSAVLKNYSRQFREATLAHETGHCLGLPHSDDPYSLMYYSPPTNPALTAPTAADVANVNALWP